MWGYTSQRFSPLRPFIIGTLLQRWNKSADEGQLQTLLFDILNFIPKSNTTELKNVCLLFSELIRRNFFSMELYIRALISRGLTSESVHSYFVEHFPFHQQSSTFLINQRNVLLYGPSYSIRLRKEPELTNKTNSELLDRINPVITRQELDRIKHEMPKHFQFKITNKLLTHFKSSTSTFTEDQFHTLMSVFIELEDYFSVSSAIDIAMESPILESLACKLALQFVDLFVALDMGPHFVRVLLRKCKSSNRQERIIEDLLRQFNFLYPDAFKLDASLKKEFPSLIVFIDGLLLQQAPTMQSPVYESNAPASPSVQSIDSLLSMAISSPNITQTLNEFVSMRNGSVMSSLLQRRDLIGIIGNCFDKYLTNSNERVVTLLREMTWHGAFFTGNDLIDAFSYVIQDRVAQARSQSVVKSISNFVIICVTRGLFTYEQLISNVIKSWLQNLRKRLSESKQNLLSLKRQFWFIRVMILSTNRDTPSLDTLSIEEQDFTLDLPIERGILWECARNNYHCQQAIPSLLKHLAEFCTKLTPDNEERTKSIESMKEIFEHYVTDDVTLHRFASQNNLFQKCIDIIMNLKSLFDKLKIINDLVAALGKLIDPNFILDATWHQMLGNTINTQHVDEFVAPFLKSTNKWKMWLDSSMV
jgi:hypothetical protein